MVFDVPRIKSRDMFGEGLRLGSFSIPCPQNSNSTFDSGLLSHTYQGISQELAPPKINEPETEHPVSRIRCHLVGRAEQGEFSQIARLEENVAWRDGVVYPPCVMEPIK